MTDAPYWGAQGRTLLPGNNYYHYRHIKKSSIPPALFHCRESGRLWDWFAHVLCKAMGKPLLMLHSFCLHLLYGVWYVQRYWMHIWTRTKPGVQKQPANTLRVAVFLILEDLTGYNFLHHLEERKKIVQNQQVNYFLKSLVPPVVTVPVSSIQAGPSCNTSWPCFSCAASAGARRPVGHHGINNVEFALITLQILTCTYYYLYLYIMMSDSRMILCVWELFVPQRRREEVSASFCPKQSWAGFYVDSWGRSSVHDPGNTHSQGSIPHDGRWSLLWSWERKEIYKKGN